MAAIGPDFKQNFVDPLPVGNIDIAPTVAAILGINLPSNGKLTGRVLQEALAGSPAPLSAPAPQTLVSAPSTSGRRTLLNFQSDHGVLYLDRACMVTGDSKSCPD
jgi:arylsulfatase A-like enzyme